jgi:N-acetyl-anhydromuramyl-L-alanine amidase AmpD
MSLKFEDLTNVLPVHAIKKPELQSKITKIVVHTTDGVGTPRGFARYAIGPNHISSTGCPTITYHYLIDGSGKAFKTCAHKNITWHAGPHNRESLGIALIYKLDNDWEELAKKGLALPEPPLPENTPSNPQLHTLLDLLYALCLKEKVQPECVYGHRELSGTGWTLEKGSRKLRKTCPGMSVNLDDLRKQLVRRFQADLKQKGLYLGDIDGKWGPKSREAFSMYVTLSNLDRGE